VMAALDVFVQPSLREGLSIALIEAAAAGLPSVACAITGNAEIVQHGQTGILVPPADPAALGGALRSLIEDPEAAREMGREARRRAEVRFTVERMVAENQHQARELAGRSRVETRPRGRLKKPHGSGTRIRRVGFFGDLPAVRTFAGLSRSAGPPLLHLPRMECAGRSAST
jgi:hypothetical protein